MSGSVIVWLCLVMTSFTSAETSSVRRVSVPEDHHLSLPCGRPGNAVWTHQVQGVIGRQRGDATPEPERPKYALLPDGSLFIRDLEEADSGEFRCNDRLVAHVQVLSGQVFSVSAGRILVLPCRGSAKPKQRWFFRGEGQAKRQPLATRYKNGEVREERADPGNRFSYDRDELQIADLQPGDAGEYLCNTETAGRVTVLPDPDNSSTQTSTTVVLNTDTIEEEDIEAKFDNGSVVAAVIGLGVAALLASLMCLLTVNMKCRRKRKYTNPGSQHRQEDTELQHRGPSSTDWELADGGTERVRTAGPHALQASPHMEEVEDLHYASLGRQNWKDLERPRATTDLHNHVIYSAVFT
ncbi:uncharacterized protein LOC124467099 isoform X2 [Hypomesus transpacificus]|uniref:uncharacterized protein LOC124467099 isoform X2 n=1 Tax=Hypomesus transpacificus TaxID=137520 RepID=UPI001F073079|nr:uncharacterized protein LOC124467099 isoform X2 [Hypomesus transpacificus]